MMIDDNKTSDTMSNERKEWMYYFVGGGFSTEFATSKEEAIKQAEERWANSPTLNPRTSSFKLVEENEEEYRSNMRAFY